MLKRSLHFLIIFSLVLPTSLVQAKEQTFQTVEAATNHYVGTQPTKGLVPFIHSARNLWKKDLNIQRVVRDRGYETRMGKAMGGYSTNAIKESGNGVLLIITMHVMAVAMGEIRRAEMLGKKLTDDERNEMFQKAAWAAIDNFELYAGGTGVFLAGLAGSAAGAIGNRNKHLRVSLKLMDRKINRSPATKKHFAKILSAGAFSLAFMTVDSYFAQLLGEAISLEGEKGVDNNEDPEVVNQRITVARQLKMTQFLFGSFGLFGTKAPSDEEKEVASRLTRNMFHILLKDPDRRARWFYNTWRKQISNGEFWTAVAVMTVASYTGMKIGAAVGGSLAGPPGAAIFAGIFGLGFMVAGGVIIFFVPPEVKAWMTTQFRKFRTWKNESDVKVRMDNLTNGLGIFKKGIRDYIPFMRNINAHWILGVLHGMGENRELLINIWMERYHEALQLKRMAEYERSIVSLGTNPDFLKKIRELDALQETEEVPGTALGTFLKENEESVDPMSLRAKEMYEGQKRSEMVIENEKVIQETSATMDEIERKLLDFYELKIKEIVEAYYSRVHSDEDKFVFPEKVSAAVSAELDKLHALHQNMQWFAMGMNPQLAQEKGKVLPENLVEAAKASSLVKISEYYEYWYKEEKVVEAYNIAKEQVDKSSEK